MQGILLYDPGWLIESWIYTKDAKKFRGRDAGKQVLLKQLKNNE